MREKGVQRERGWGDGGGEKNIWIFKFKKKKNIELYSIKYKNIFYLM